MKKVLLAGVAALAIVGTTVAYAQYRPGFQQTRMSPEDRAAFADARIAAVHAGLKLTTDQEKLWPPVEAAVRDFTKIRIDRANARMKQDDAQKQDPVARLREHADRMSTTGAALKKIADAADPLYKTLDDGQKTRLAMLTHREHRGGGREGGREGWRHHERGGGDGDRGRGFGRGRGYDRGGYDGEGPGGDHGGRGERL